MMIPRCEKMRTPCAETVCFPIAERTVPICGIYVCGMENLEDKLNAHGFREFICHRIQCIYRTCHVTMEWFIRLFLVV